MAGEPLAHPMKSATRSLQTSCLNFGSSVVFKGVLGEIWKS